MPDSGHLCTFSPCFTSTLVSPSTAISIKSAVLSFYDYTVGLYGRLGPIITIITIIATTTTTTTTPTATSYYAMVIMAALLSRRGHCFLPCGFLWSPYVIGQTIIFLPCSFFLLHFPRLISAAVDRMSRATHGVALVRI